MIFFTDRFIPARFDGYNVGPISFIRPQFINDVGLIAHENTHQQQFWRSPLLMGLRYLLSRKWRQQYEVEAYRAQLACESNGLDVFAFDLATKYDLGISVAEARALLVG
jgi:hypothetical protein